MSSLPVVEMPLPWTLLEYLAVLDRVSTFFGPEPYNYGHTLYAVIQNLLSCPSRQHIRHHCHVPNVV